MKTFIALAAAFLLYVQPAHAFTEYVPINNHAVTIAGTSAASTTPTAIGVNVIRLTCTAACYVAIAASGQAVYAATPSVTEVTSVYIPANTPEYFRIGSRSKIAVIQVSGGGTLYVTEMSK